MRTKESDLGPALKSFSFRASLLRSAPAWFAASVAAAILSAALFSGPARGQSPAPSAAAVSATPAPSPDAWPLQIDQGAAGLLQTLRKLRTRASVLMIVAHPDDEDSGMLTYETRGQGARGMMLTLNRGEGGQNVMSDDFETALGLLRTQELLSADRYSDVQQYFTSVVDFGFAKSREEALQKWGHDRVLADVVRVVRMTRPLVVASTFVGGPTDGHGHHSVAGQMAQEVFNAAGDPNMFPEQIRAGLQPWAPAKMYARAPIRATGAPIYSYIDKQRLPSPISVQVVVPEGTYDPVLGATYLQIARTGLTLQKSQNGGGRTPLAGPDPVSYHRFGSHVTAAAKENSFFDGIDVSLVGIASLAPAQENGFLQEGLREIQATVDRATSEFSFTQPEKIAPILAQGLKETNALASRVAASSLPEQAKYGVLYELQIKEEQFQHAIVQALGISLVSTTGPATDPERGRTGPFGPAVPTDSSAFAVPGQEFTVTVHLVNPTATAMDIKRLWLETPSGENWTIEPESPVPAQLGGGEAIDQRFRVRIPEDAAATRPYFTRPNDGQAYYDIKDPRYQDLPLAPYPLSAWVEFAENGVEVKTGQVVQTSRQETGQGTVINPMMIAPAVSVLISPKAGVTPIGAKSFMLSALVHNESEAGSKGMLRLALPEGWRSEPQSVPFSIARAGAEQTVPFEVFPDRLEQKPYTITAVAESGGRQYREGFVTVGYPGVRPYNFYEPATFRTSGVDVKLSTGLRIGYIMGTGDSVPEFLKELGVQAEFLSPQDVMQGDLRKYSVIVLGIRVNDARPELATHSDRLLDFVKQGGTLIVQYHYGQSLGPYPFTLPGSPGADAERVVDETAPVMFLDAQSPLLNWPNKIAASDFDGWIAGRGNGFVSHWDEHYQTVLETHDPGQAPQKGGLVYTRYGRGIFVYTALSLYRQLPEGVPGAYRLFANLLSLPRNPAFQLPSLKGGPVRPPVPQR
jgi:LmbE family N-acetylglucosaminyl deacetylase